MKTQDAIDFYGSRDALAKALRVSRPTTYYWGETIPETYQYKLQVITGGKLVANDQAPEQAA